ncbi:MAG: exodeoxyribonuclease VII large subunit, partial [Erysipelotrichaceae bacterium]|nr:exodeoxyribonuclease VII large subunit [Erysipelotrichaceae bacterium]
VNVYENRGELQLIVSDMQLSGQGNFYIQFERTRKKLEPLGYFDESRKKAIPAYPEQISVVTGANTAALQDIRITIARRWPHVVLKEVYAIVQGKEAVESVVSALKQADSLGSDILILARGGGSVDDLWCFNDENIAKAIYDCKTPVITGIGHEIDVTIADLVADLRAATPTAAATAATPDYHEVQDNITNYVSLMHTSLENRINNIYQTLDYHSVKLAGYGKTVDQISMKLSSMKNIISLSLDKNISTYSEMINNRLSQMNGSMMKMVTEQQGNLVRERTMLMNTVERFYENQSYRYANLITSLDNLSPLKTMQRGYAISSQKGKVIKSVDEIEMNEDMSVRYVDGTIDVKPLRRVKHG